MKNIYTIVPTPPDDNREWPCCAYKNGIPMHRPGVPAHMVRRNIKAYERRDAAAK